MRFEVQNALTDLNQKTPEYIRSELFAHGSLQVRKDAIEILQELDPEEKSAQQLRDMIRLY